MRQVEQQAVVRSHGDIRCADVMSRDVIGIDWDAEPDHARQLLLKHNIRTLPVKDPEGRLLGTVGLRELSESNDTIAQALSRPAIADAGDPALSLLPVLTDGRTHAVIVVDVDRQILGLISQTDLLSAMARLLLNKDAASVSVA